MKRPRITVRILDGIIDATSLYLAGPPDNGMPDDSPEGREQLRAEESVRRADEWAKAMRDWLARPPRSKVPK